MRKNPKSRTVGQLGVMAGVILSAAWVQAGATTWNSGSLVDDNWSNPDNWSAGAPGSGDTAVFDGTASGGTAGDFAGVTGFSVVDSDATLQKITFGASGAAGSTTHNVTIGPGTTLLVTGSGSSTLDNADFAVAVDNAVNFSGTNTANVTFTGGGSLQVGNAGENTAQFVLGRRPNNGSITSGNTNAAVDLSGLSSFTANVDQFAMGISGWNGAAASGSLTLAASNTINAKAINLGDTYNTGAGNSNFLKLGQTNDLHANDIYVGHQKTGVTMSFNTGLSGPTLTITDLAGTGGANLYVGYNNAGGTGTAPTSVLDTTAGTITATLNNLVIGGFGSGAGNSTATFNMGAGTLTANSMALAVTGIGGTATQPQNTKGTFSLTNGGSVTVNGDVTKGGGVSTIQVANGTFNATGSLAADVYNVDRGSSTVGGNLSVGSLRVGYNGAPNESVTLTVSGSTATIGSGTSSSLIVGRREGNLGTSTTTHETFNSKLDLSAVTTATINVGNFLVATTDGQGSNQESPSADVLLAQNTTVTATKLTLGDSTGVGMQGTQHLGLGTTTAMNVDTVVVGGNKTGSQIDFQHSGSTLNIHGSDGVSRANWYLGQQNVSTGGGASGVVSGSGNTINAYLNNLVIGSKPNGATGNTQGIFTFAGGNIDVTTLTLGQRNDAGSAGTVKGTFNFSGGTLTAGTITRGSGNGNNAGDVAAFNWTGGKLSVGTFGSATLPFNLVQNGSTTVFSAGGDAADGLTTVYGNYTLTSGTFRANIDGLAGGGVSGGNDLLTVNGTVSLSGALDLVVDPSVIGGIFTLIDNDGAGAVIGHFTGLLEGGTFNAGGIDWKITYAGGTGNDVVISSLTAVPTPAALPMGLALLSGLGLRRRRRA